MGYRTFVSIKVIQYGPEQTEKDFKDIIEQADACMLDFDETDRASFEDNNGNCLDEIVQLSANYPDMILETYIDGTSEDSNDQRAVRIRNGEKEENSAEVIYPPFCEILTEEEKERHTKAGKAAYGRDDLLEVSKKIAEEYGNPSLGDELYVVMANAAFNYMNNTK